MGSKEATAETVLELQTCVCVCVRIITRKWIPIREWGTWEELEAGYLGGAGEGDGKGKGCNTMKIKKHITK